MKTPRRSSPRPSPKVAARPRPKPTPPPQLELPSPVSDVLPTPARARLKRLLKNLADHTTSAGLKDQAPSTVAPGARNAVVAEQRTTELCSTLSPKALPSRGNVRIAADASFEVKEQRGHKIVLQVIGRRSDYCLTTATSSPTGKACYVMSDVKSCLPELSESVVMRPLKRTDWVSCLGEMAALCEEASRQRAEKLQLDLIPPPLSLAYLADRIDIDDPLWGYQVRSRSKGHLQGFVTVTAFTSWTLDFEWTNSHPKSGMPAARMANAAILRRRHTRRGGGRPWESEVEHEPHEAEEDETPAQIAAEYDVPASTVVAINQPLYGQDFTAGCRLREGTVVHLSLIHISEPTRPY
eukprot:TRINITY_DN32731_c0_g1_i3.p1 TRINITY_DN32731_c0_g1~~TRINITY_DN32731_c0_g1_i3.p1  ORF type:complete len:353 (+),score=47.96 TRINITY_DN32731_c0_g1_i3:153-1211(+)